MGLLSKYKLKSQLEEKRLQFEIDQYEKANSILSEATARLVQPDSDEDLWFKSGGARSENQADNELGYDHYDMLDVAFKKYHTDLFSRAIVRNLCKFVLGKGPIIKPRDKNKKVLEKWERFSDRNTWSEREKEIARRVFRDGEIFIRKIVDQNNGDTLIRFIPPSMIRNPVNVRQHNEGESVSYGIGTDIDDIETVRTYYYCTKDSRLIKKFTSDEIIHIKILSDSDMKRGVSFLLVALPMIKKYMDWLDDRAVLNKVRSAIALVRTVEGTSGTVESIRSSRQSQYRDADKHKAQAFPRGTVLTASKGISYQLLSPNIQASDVKDDGRAMLLAIAAGCGFPEMILTADFSNANYSSSMIAQNPFVREIEDWQDFFSVYYKGIFRDVITNYIQFGDERLPESTNLKCTLEWPPLILADIKKNNEAREIQHRNKVLSKKTWQLKEGLDPDAEERNLEEEQTKDIYKTPFNMPVAPVNQFGSEDDDEDE